ncbi:EF-hand domain pair [Cohaesibacter marisflavi]|uniref:EF-hand domain pair n=1 Tax=Cohaesibacter marisflavi TaxID=655353 RepID=A0A1I5ELF4_9HYPH|nr:EF-hand domain-containing protein [Cohaesibacter marisflavi]SFO11901.1 EF-hand domain pair [Cohaesibacter marisflavi]
MKKLLILTGTIVALSAPAMAQDIMILDANSDGVVTLEEFSAAYPSLENVEQVFTAADTDTDGVLSQEELIAAYESHLIPEME